MKYLIRHAEKTDSSVHANLTEQGKLDSINYGKKLLKNDTKVDQIITSPIGRCIQTSELISKGLEQTIPIIEAIELGNPGVYISDDKKAMEVFNQYSLLEIMNMQLSRKTLIGFHGIDNSSERLRAFFNSFNENTLFISHDAIIIPYLNWVNKKASISSSDLIEYLFTLQLKDV